MQKTKAKVEQRKHQGLSVRISAHWLPVLRHFMSDHSPIDSEVILFGSTHGLHIEPHPDGGITVMATNGRMLCAVHDKEGKTTKPVRAMLSSKFLGACEPPKLPNLWSEGEWLEPPEVPAWMSPKWVFLWEVGAWVSSADDNAEGFLWHEMIEESNVHRIGDEYRLPDGKPIAWQSLLAAEGVQDLSPILVNPLYLGRVCVAANSAGAKSIRLTGTGAEKPIRIEFVGVPEITALLMPVREDSLSRDRETP